MTKRPSLAKMGLAQHVATKGEPAAKKKPVGTKAPAPTTGKRFLQARLNDDGWQALKILSITERRPLQGLVIEALNDLLKKYRQAPVVEGPASDSDDE